MEKGEIDQKVAELSRSGSNPALRGVLFAQMYMKIGKNTNEHFWSKNNHLRILGLNFIQIVMMMLWHG